MRRTAFTAASALLLALLAPAAPALAATGTAVECGATVSGPAYLAHDLTCAADGGLTLRDGAVLDLNAHTLRGPGAGGTAVTLPAGGDYYVKNGTIAGWANGVESAEYFADQSTVKIFKVAFVQNDSGIAGSSSDITVNSSKFAGNGDGIFVSLANVTVVKSTFSDNSFGIESGTGGSIAVSNSSFTSNQIAVACSETGLDVSSSSFARNKIASRTYFCDGPTFTRNNFYKNDLALVSSWEANGGVVTVTNNSFASNGVGVSMAASSALIGNSFIRNTTALTAEPFIIPQVVALDKNFFSLNGDAVTITGPAVLKDTVAIKNTGYGIYAPDATDQGGNRAYLNGTSPQCTGVVC